MTDSTLLFLSEITGGIALLFTFLTFFFDDRRLILWIQAGSLVFYGLHLYLLGFTATALFLCIQVGRNIFFAKQFSRNTDIIFYCIVLYPYTSFYIDLLAYRRWGFSKLVGIVGKYNRNNRTINDKYNLGTRVVFPECFAMVVLCYFYWIIISHFITNNIF